MKKWARELLNRQNILYFGLVYLYIESVDVFLGLERSKNHPLLTHIASSDLVTLRGIKVVLLLFFLVHFFRLTREKRMKIVLKSNILMGIMIVLVGVLALGQAMGY